MTTTHFDKNIADSIFLLHERLAIMEDQIAAKDDLGMASSAEFIGKLTQSLISDAISNERANGRSWAQIGDHFGISRQGAQKRFGKTSTDNEIRELRYEILNSAEMNPGVDK